MNYGTGTDTEFDDVRHGYAPPRQQNRVVPPHHNETRAEDVAFGFADAPYQQSGDAPHDADEAALDAMHEAPLEPADPTDPATIVEDISNNIESLIDTGRAAYEAEIALLKARADVIASAAKKAAVFVSISAAAGLVTLLAIGFGAIFILADFLTHTQAVAIVVSALALLTGITAWFGKRQFDRITGAIWERIDG